LIDEIVADSEIKSLSNELKFKILRCQEILSAQEDFISSNIPPQSQLLTKIVQETNKEPETSKRAAMLSGNIVGK
jgi:hypothetical protein